MTGHVASIAASVPLKTVYCVNYGFLFFFWQIYHTSPNELAMWWNKSTFPRKCTWFHPKMVKLIVFYHYPSGRWFWGKLNDNRLVPFYLERSPAESLFSGLSSYYSGSCAVGLFQWSFLWIQGNRRNWRRSLQTLSHRRAQTVGGMFALYLLPRGRNR